MSFGIHQSQHIIPGTPRCTMLLKSLICEVIIKLGLSSFLGSKAYAPLPLCLAKPVILKLSLKIALTKFLCSTSIPIPAICSSIGFVGETHAFLWEILTRLPYFLTYPFQALMMFIVLLPLPILVVTVSLHLQWIVIILCHMKVKSILR